MSSEVVGIWQDRLRTEGEWAKNVFAETMPWFPNPTLPSFLFPFLSPAVSTAQGSGLKVACVSAAVSDESVAGDSGVYEASVQRWVPRVLDLWESGICKVWAPEVCAGDPQEGMPR